jgi:hypothetical protein
VRGSNLNWEITGLGDAGLGKDILALGKIGIGRVGHLKLIIGWILPLVYQLVVEGRGDFSLLGEGSDYQDDE